MRSSAVEGCDLRLSRAIPAGVEGSGGGKGSNNEQQTHVAT